ncbi:MAG TPA: HEAT repeat domain-containing protein, partial [Thermodesulfobacteriota bacterium]|nr:HEAT repeat domain-containing protein [Thermodesulfobacteriota bacterium]
MAANPEVEEKALDVSEEILPLEQDGIEEVVLHARDLMNILVKTIKAFRLYPPDNPALTGFRDLLFRKFQFFLKKHRVFSFKIEEFGFAVNNRLLYENKDLKTSLAFFLYKDGLRELRFVDGLEEWEIQAFLDIVKTGDQVNKLEDDLVTLLWERDFIHISYQSTDEYLDETPVVIPENVEQFRKNLVMEPVAHSVEADFQDEETGQETDYYQAMIRAASPPSLVTNRDLYFLTPEEIESLRREVEEETSSLFLFNIIDILFEIMALEKKPEPFKDVIIVLSKMLDALLTLGEFRKAADLLSRLYITLKTYQLEDWQAKMIQQLAESAGEPSRTEKVGKVLERKEGVRLEDVGAYLKLLKPNAVEPLMNLLGDLTSPKARRTLCDAVCEIGKDSIDQITTFLGDRRWFLVRNVIYILGRVGKEDVIPSLQKGLAHREMRVRREAVQALGNVGGAKAFPLLVKALEDRDVRIRCTAALNLGKIGGRNSLPHLLGAVQSKDFHRRESAERKAYFDAVGLAGSNDAVPILQRLLMRKNWLRRRKINETRLGAASALALIGTREAKAALHGGQNSSNAHVRKACLEALKRTAPKDKK